jgi:5,10-methylenetetrahydrofolate reductase
MDLCNTSIPQTHSLSERIAREVFDVLPERGPIVVILDREGERWISHPEEFAALGVEELVLKDLRAKVDDGAEPVITQVGQTSVTLAQLATDQTDCGYVAVVLPGCTPESALTHIDLVEALLSQVSLIARLVEKTASLTRGQMNHYSGLAFSLN